MANRTDLFAKPEVKRALATIREVVRQAMPGASFEEREEQSCAIINEAVRELLREEELQQTSDGFGDERDG